MKRSLILECYLNQTTKALCFSYAVRHFPPDNILFITSRRVAFTQDYTGSDHEIG